MPRPKKLVWDFETALAHLRDADGALSSAALGALTGATKQNLVAFARTWSDLPAERRRAAAQEMVELAERNFELDYNLLFRHLLNDEDARVRMHGIEGLWEDEDPTLVKPLIAFLRSDPAAPVRAAAADALGRFVLLAEYGRLPDASAQLIREALLATTRSTAEDLVVRCCAVESLAYWSHEIVRDVITAAYADDASEMRASAVAAMGRSADTYWRKIAAAELDSPDAQMRFEATRTAGELENRQVTRRLIELLDDSDRQVQGAAITALGQLGGKQAKEALMLAAQSDDEALAPLAEEALQELDFISNSELLLLDVDPAAEAEADAALDDDEDWEEESDA